MVFFSAIKEGRFAAQVIKEMAKMLEVPPASMPEWMKDSTKEQAGMHIKACLSPKDVAQMKVEMSGQQVLDDIGEGN